MATAVTCVCVDAAVRANANAGRWVRSLAWVISPDPYGTFTCCVSLLSTPRETPYIGTYVSLRTPQQELVSWVKATGVPGCEGNIKLVVSQAGKLPTREVRTGNDAPVGSLFSSLDWLAVKRAALGATSATAFWQFKLTHVSQSFTSWLISVNSSSQ